MKYLARIAQNFLKPGEDVVVEPYGNGIIHDTYLVSYGKGHAKFILQRINLHVFKKPELIMQNIRIVCDHVRRRLEQERNTQFAEWQMLDIIPTIDGRDYFVDEQGLFWRGLSFIHDAAPLENVRNQEQAHEIGTALGRFHYLVHGLDPGRLHDTLPGFHIISHYLAHFDEVVKTCDVSDQSSRLQYCFDFIKNRRQWAPVLENALAEGRLQHRVVHGDPKSNNVMLDIKTGKAVGMIDLDTVKPGLILYDIADCLRSCCNTLADDSGDIETVAVNSDLCQSLLSGYRAEYNLLSDTDYEHLYDAIRLIAYELGLRFVTDFLESDVYFKTEYKGHNLDRAMVQFKLAESIESQETQLRGLINDCRPSCSEGQ